MNDYEYMVIRIEGDIVHKSDIFPSESKARKAAREIKKQHKGSSPAILRRDNPEFGKSPWKPLQLARYDDEDLKMTTYDPSHFC